MDETTLDNLGAQFNEIIKGIEKNKNTKDSGKEIVLPYPFKRLAQVLPGIEKGQHICVTAGTGISKSKFTRFIYVYSVYEFYKNCPQCGIKPKVFLFLLEDSWSKVLKNMICYRLKSHFKMDIALKDLESKGRALSDKELEAVKSCEEYFKDMGEIVTIIDYIHNPYGIYKEVRSYLEANGSMEYSERVDEAGKIIKIPKKYTPNDPESHVIVILDNLSNLTKEDQHKNTWEAMSEWTAKYARRLLCKLFNCTVVTIQQQDLESQKLSFSMYQGEAIKAKVKPSVASLGDNKTVSRDYHLIFGLFSPERFNFEEDLGYDITLLQNNYRNLSILKSNESDVGYEIGLFFNGASETFVELPHPRTQAKELNEFYDHIKVKLKR